MDQFIAIKGMLLTRYEWAGGYKPGASTKSRQKLVKEGKAQIVDSFEDMNQTEKVTRKVF